MSYDQPTIAQRVNILHKAVKNKSMPLTLSETLKYGSVNNALKMLNRKTAVTKLDQYHLTFINYLCGSINNERNVLEAYLDKYVD